MGADRLSGAVGSTGRLPASRLRRHRLAAGELTMAKTYEPADARVVVVIGSGAGGGTVANELAQRAVGVVCMEAGRRLALGDIVNDSRIMNQRMSWLDERIGPAVGMCKTVGGTTMMWSGVCPRLLAHEFRARSTYGAMSGASLIDWPLALE